MEAVSDGDPWLIAGACVGAGICEMEDILGTGEDDWR